MNTSLTLKTITGIGYNTLARVFILVLTAAANVILARNLTADDYGIIGFGMIFINFLVQFSDFGISRAVIRKHELTDGDLYTGFTFKFIIGVAAFVIAFALSPFAKLIFDNDAVSDVIIILSLNFVVSNFAFIPHCLLTRDLDYKRMFIPQTGTALVNYALSIILAINGYKFWSIVIANIASVIVNVILLNYMKPVRIRFAFDRKVAVEFTRFGGNLFLSGIVIFGIFNADRGIIGSVMGSAVLGFYTLAYNWGSIICGIVQDAVHNVLFPAFSKIQHDRDGIKKSYLQVLEFVGFLSVFVNIGMLACSYDFLYFILGRGTGQWLPALISFNVLCVYGIIRSLMEPIGNVILAVGKSELLFKSTLIVGITELALLYPVMKYFNIEGVAVLVTAAYSLQVFVYYPFLKRNYNINAGELLSSLKGAIVATVGVAVVIIPFNYYVTPSLISFVIKLPLITTVYILTYGISTRWKIIKEIKNIVEKRSISV
ncbi:MAG: lipopolysaccharide biosynthesis protein [Spirochaetes bacterium]|nr:lipopolysaccharide biosynthesis protein [Spirochaetota bacterium]